MVLDEGPEDCNVVAGGFHGVDTVYKGGDTAGGGLEGLGDPVVGWVVQDTTQVVLVWTHI